MQMTCSPGIPQAIYVYENAVYVKYDGYVYFERPLPGYDNSKPPIFPMTAWYCPLPIEFDDQGNIISTEIVTSGGFGILGENPNDNGSPIVGEFVSGIHGLDDNTQHKLFRRIGLESTALPADGLTMTVRALDYKTEFSGLPSRQASGGQWDNSQWDKAVWSGPIDATQSTSLPDDIQGRYIQFKITFITMNAENVVVHGPVSFEYRPRYRYGRR